MAVIPRLMGLPVFLHGQPFCVYSRYVSAPVVTRTTGVRTYCEKTKNVAVDVNDETGVAIMTMQRKPVNSLNTSMLAEMGDAIQQLEKNKCSGLILTSALPTVFSAGLDIRCMVNVHEKDSLLQFWGTLQNTWLSLYRSSFPTVAAVNGHSPAGGCLLALSCEYRVMVGPNFKIGLNETQAGIVAPPWTEMCMRNAIGRRQTEKALLPGRMFTVDEALKIGLIDEVAADKDDAIARSEKFLTTFARISPVARKLMKEQVRGETIKWMEENMIKERNSYVDFLLTPAVQKGLALYLNSFKS